MKKILIIASLMFSFTFQSNATLASAVSAWSIAHPGAPFAVYIGHSIMEGYTNYSAGYPSWAPSGLVNGNIAHRVYVNSGNLATGTNFGVQGATMSFVELVGLGNGFTLQPKYMFVLGAVNTLQAGGTFETMSTNWNNLRARAVASNTILCAMSELPAPTLVTDANRITYNNKLKLWTETNGGGTVFVDSAWWMSMATNQAILEPGYTFDNIHPTTNGTEHLSWMPLNVMKKLEGDNITIACHGISEAFITNAVAFATNNNIITFPGDTANLTNLITISKPVTLIGSNRLTILKDWSAEGAQLFSFVGTANLTNNVFGFDFQKGRTNYNYAQMIKTDFINTDDRFIRFASNKFTHLNRSLFLIYSTVGLFDHNEVYGDSNGVPAVLGYIKNNGWDGAQGDNLYGDGSQYSINNRLGSSKSFYIESNFITNCYNGNLTLLDSQAGGGYVNRSNYIWGLSSESHGTEATRERSGVFFEIYNNVWGGYGDRNTPLYFRGGVGVAYSNTMTGWSTAVFSLLNNRMRDSIAAPFGGSDGRNIYDSNHLSNPFITGTISSTGSLVANDSGKSMTPNQYVGYTIRKTSGKAVTLTRVGSTVTASSTGHGFSSGNLVSIYGANEQAYNNIYSITVLDANTFTFANEFTPATPATGTIKACLGGYFSEITANSATNFTFKDSIYSGNYTMVFAVSDTYEINKVVKCMDGPGRVGGPNLAGAYGPSQTTVAAQQTAVGWYEWNNTRDAGVDIDFSSGSASIVENEDFFNDTVKPGYTALIYPHPAITGISSLSASGITNRFGDGKIQFNGKVSLQ